jgi:hypothetical protein
MPKPWALLVFMHLNGTIPTDLLDSVRRWAEDVPNYMRSEKGLGEARRQIGMKQAEFWSMYGISASSGSRYEREQGMTLSAVMLVKLHLTGLVPTLDLIRNMEALKRIQT